MSICYAFVENPLGEMLIASTGVAVCYAGFTDGKRELLLNDLKNYLPRNTEYCEQKDKLITEVSFALSNPRGISSIPIVMYGTEFQQKVWRMLTGIPAGSAISYKELAIRMGIPESVRAVANAIGQNRLAIIVPCHRVIRSTGALSGYRWGIERKKKLLEQER